ncbi:zinc ribbon domain-containing protein [Nitrosomonas sp.]|uniref:zinc ribbon domain-containing protein n=1 Tax=Nitrosomonas sp. TaxID=42353 RepID=UPI0028458D33|nr:zinc ribbon domain-containing protein [Nitrosomonas sp.]MDR4514616.1 zinc ribbon domain-containing protein [Nitrosomonas sp.]
MLCPNCGTENTEQAEYCTQCAGVLKTETERAAQSDDAAKVRETVEAVNQSEANVAREELPDSSEDTSTEDRVKPRITNLDFQSDEAGEKPVVSNVMNLTILFLSIPIPPLGIAMGYTYLKKTHPEAKKAGKVWLIWGMLTLLVLVFLTIFRT